MGMKCPSKKVRCGRCSGLVCDAPMSSYVVMTKNNFVVDERDSLQTAKLCAKRRGNSRIASLDAEGYMTRVWCYFNGKWEWHIPSKVKPMGDLR